MAMNMASMLMCFLELDAVPIVKPESMPRHHGSVGLSVFICSASINIYLGIVNTQPLSSSPR